MVDLSNSCKAEENMNIKIYMCCHKSYDSVPPLCVPIQGGRAINPPIENIDGDNVGDNISEKNREYCELTVQYYAWKNEEHDAYGFCHYRRFFCFGKNTKKPYLVFGKMTDGNKKAYFGTEEDALRIISENDIVVTRSEDLGTSVRSYYENAVHHYKEDLSLFLEVLSEKYPGFMPYANSYLSGNRQYLCNMFVMKKVIFDEYCSMLFSVLEEFDKRKTMHGDFQSDRTDGYLGERFLGMFISYAVSKGLRIYEVPRIDVGCTLKKRIIYKLFPPESKLRFFIKKLVKGVI